LSERRTGILEAKALTKEEELIKTEALTKQ
jgi:hypothetical protein